MLKTSSFSVNNTRPCMPSDFIDSSDRHSNIFGNTDRNSNVVCLPSCLISDFEPKVGCFEHLKLTKISMKGCLSWTLVDRRSNWHKSGNKIWKYSRKKVPPRIFRVSKMNWCYESPSNHGPSNSWSIEFLVYCICALTKNSFLQITLYTEFTIRRINHLSKI